MTLCEGSKVMEKKMTKKTQRLQDKDNKGEQEEADKGS
jgi:hypothetical protein